MSSTRRQPPPSPSRQHSVRGTFESAFSTGVQVVTTAQRTESELSRASSAGAPDAKKLERRFSESELSAADTPVAPVVRARHNVEELPADREARGEITLKASAHHTGAIRAVCSVRHGVLTLTEAQPANRDSSSAGSQSRMLAAVLAEVPTADLAVGLREGRTKSFTLATLHAGKMYDKIHCLADDEATRDEWIAVLRLMGVAIFDHSAPSGRSHRLEPGFLERPHFDDKQVLGQRFKERVLGMGNPRNQACVLS
jgi:hypothetical protein